MARYVVGEFGDFKLYEDAKEYLADLKKRYPDDDAIVHLDILTYPDGRPEEHAKLLWASEGVYDFIERKVVTVDKAWLWSGELGFPPAAKLIGARNRYLRVCLEETETHAYVQRCLRHLSRYSVAGRTENPEEVVIAYR